MGARVLMMSAPTTAELTDGQATAGTGSDGTVTAFEGRTAVVEPRLAERSARRELGRSSSLPAKCALVRWQTHLRTPTKGSNA